MSRKDKKQNKKENKNSNFSWLPKPLGEKIAVIMALSVFALAILSVIAIMIFALIIGLMSAARATGESKEIRYYPAGKRASNVETFGECLYLQKSGDDTYKIVSEDDEYSKKLEWQTGCDSYYDPDSLCFVWYDSETNEWQYWFRDISKDYGAYGWIKIDSTVKIQQGKDKWVGIPEKYDYKILWHIE